MGFRKDSFATVWGVEVISDTHTKIQISISRRNKTTEKYEKEFSGFISCIGTATAKKAACLKEGDRIKLGDVDVTTYYNKDKNITYTNFKMFSFEVEKTANSATNNTEPQPTVDDGEVSDERLPF